MAAVVALTKMLKFNFDLEKSLRSSLNDWPKYECNTYRQPIFSVYITESLNIVEDQPSEGNEHENDKGDGNKQNGSPETKNEHKFDKNHNEEVELDFNGKLAFR